LERKHNERFWRIMSARFKADPTQEKDLLVYYWFLVPEIGPIEETIKVHCNVLLFG